MNTLVTCMGESLIDFVPLNAAGQSESESGTGEDKPEEQRAALPKDKTSTDFRMHAGGSIFNVSIALARLGHHAAFAGKIAEDFFGHYLLLALKNEGVDTRFVTTVNGQSALAIVAMEEGEPIFSFYGEGTADALLTVEDVPESLYQETGILHVGSVSLLRGTTPATVLATVERLKGKVLLSLDPNIRASLIRDESKYRALIQRLIALTDILKLSNVDLTWLLPGTTVEESLLHLCGLGPALVIITRGKKGVLARSGSSHTLQVATMPVPVIDTIGAGDAFCAGVLAWLADQAITSRERVLALTEQELRSALSFASAVAGLTCTRASANPPRRSEVVQFLQSGGLKSP